MGAAFPSAWPREKGRREKEKGENMNDKEKELFWERYRTKFYPRTLYVIPYGPDSKLEGDIKYHRVRLVENIDIWYQRNIYNLFMEFNECTHVSYRLTNKRTGAPLKKSVPEVINTNGLHLETQYEEREWGGSYFFNASYRLGELEREIWNRNYSYTRKDILDIVNQFVCLPNGDKYGKVVIIDEKAAEIINKRGGYREKAILENDPVFTVSETWNDTHKVVRVTERIKTEYAPGCYRHELGNSCEVELISERITN